MADVVVHGIPGSPYGRSVLLALEEKRAPYRFARMTLGAQKLPEHLARNPFGPHPFDRARRVRALRDAGLSCVTSTRRSPGRRCSRAGRARRRA